MTAVAIIQARMGSTRLPGKVLMELAGMPVLGWVIRAADAIAGIDRVVVATSLSPADDAVAGWCSDRGVTCRRGPEADVLARIATAAEAEQATTVMRLTADCPLLDPDVCAQVLALLQLTGADYATNADPRRWPDGLDCEVVRAQVLAEAAERAVSAHDREHVTAFIRNNRYSYNCEFLDCPLPGLGHHRWTLDRQEDYDFLQELVSRLPAGRPPGWIEVLRATGELSPTPDPACQPRTNPGDSAGGRYQQSALLFERTLRTVPTATQTFSKSHLQFPPGHAPLFLTHGRGGRVWDVDGNCYVDLICGLLPVVLGYCDADVDTAINRQMAQGISFSLATEHEAALAERLVEIIPCAEKVRFGKNGSDATSAAIRVARAFTGRERIAVCGYHGWQDWYIGATTRDKGIPDAVKALTHKFAFNDIDTLEQLLQAHRDEFAAVILEPITTEEPAPGYLQALKDLVHRHGALLIFDEIVTGFRFHLGGAQALFDVTPDLASFGKAMANGMPISAVVGRADVMAEMDEVFFSGTFGGEALSLVAAIATIDKMQREDVIARLWRNGEALVDRVRKEVDKCALTDTIQFQGMAPWMLLAVRDHPTARSALVKTILRRELLDRGVLVGGSHNLCYAHDEADLDQVCAAYAGALEVLAELLERPDLEASFNGQVIEPVFSVRAAPS